MTDHLGQSGSEPTLGVIYEPHFGVGDRGTVNLWFSVYVTESSAALQVFDVDEGAEILKAYGVRDAADLAGRPCWVDMSKPGLITWVKAWSKRK